MSVSAALKVMESEIGMSEYIPLSHHDYYRHQKALNDGKIR